MLATTKSFFVNGWAQFFLLAKSFCFEILDRQLDMNALHRGVKMCLARHIPGDHLFAKTSYSKLNEHSGRDNLCFMAT